MFGKKKTIAVIEIDGVISASSKKSAIASKGFSLGKTLEFLSDLEDEKQALDGVMLRMNTPGGTAGGIKTGTVALVFAAILSVLRGDSEVLLFNRRIPTMNVLRAFTIILIFTLLGAVGAIYLQTREPGGDFFNISALTTTGLSIGDTTAKLSAGGKLFLVFLMFMGRVGPFTVLLFLLGREKHTPIRYPEERIIIG